MSAALKHAPAKRSKVRQVIIELTLEDPANPWRGAIGMYGDDIEALIAGQREPVDAVDAMALALSEQIQRLLAGRLN
jgi:hypothetical protein